MCCESGFHFCKKASDCFRNYSFDHNNKVAEVEALGEIDTNLEGSKCCTNKIHIIREITWQEVLELVNLGKRCTGNRNSGDCNSGNYNSGNWNSGNWNSGNHNSGYYNNGNWNSGNYNSGNYNSGNWNSGDHNSCNHNSGNQNSGYWNSGDYNSGHRNSGDYNSGNHNSGDWNKTCFSTGCFNTEQTKIFLFNKPSDWTYIDWLNSEARRIMAKIPSNVLSWIPGGDMTDIEKELNPECSVTGGYLKYVEKEHERQKWWDNLHEQEKKVIKAIPNFDKDIFKEITGIDVDKGED